MWRGSGALALRSGGAWRRVADIEWRCHVLSLLLARAEFSVTGSGRDTQLRAVASLRAGGASFSDVDISAPAGVIEPLLAAAAFARPGGRLRLLADSIQVGAASLRGTASVEWTDAGLGGMSAQRLGDYRLQITGSGDRAELALSTLRGDLRVQRPGRMARGPAAAGAAARGCRRCHRAQGPRTADAGAGGEGGRRHCALHMVGAYRVRCRMGLVCRPERS